MGAASRAWCGLVPAAVVSMGCAQLFGGEGAQSPADEPATPYRLLPGEQAVVRPAPGSAPALYAGAPRVVEVAVTRGPTVVVVHAVEPGAGPVTVVFTPPRVAPAPPFYGMPRMLPSPYGEDDEAPPPPRYKPSPYEEPRQPVLYRYD